MKVLLFETRAAPRNLQSAWGTSTRSIVKTSCHEKLIALGRRIGAGYAENVSNFSNGDEFARSSLLRICRDIARDIDFDWGHHPKMILELLQKGRCSLSSELAEAIFEDPGKAIVAIGLGVSTFGSE